jgi:modulator of FtsH protease
MLNRDPRQIGEMYSDSYDPSVGAPVAVAPAAVRAGFLQKVYMTFLGGVALAMLTAFMAVNSVIKSGELSGPVALVARHYMVTFIIFIVLAMAASAVARVRGVNVLVYAAFTAFTGLLISPLFLVAYNSGGYAVIWNAFGLTALVFGGLTMYVFISGKDFSFLGGMLTVGIFVLLGFIIGTFFFQTPAFIMGVTVAGLLLFALFVLYDTSVIMRHLGPTEWVAGALRLFIDFINMFIRILMLLSNRR